MLGLGATWTGSGPVQGTLTFTGYVADTVSLTIDDHPLGHGITSYVATYSETGPGARRETVEVLAMSEDRLDFLAGPERLTARRYRNDTWPVSDERLARMAGR